MCRGKLGLPSQNLRTFEMIVNQFFWGCDQFFRLLSIYWLSKLVQHRQYRVERFPKASFMAFLAFIPWMMPKHRNVWGLFWCITFRHFLIDQSKEGTGQWHEFEDNGAVTEFRPGTEHMNTNYVSLRSWMTHQHNPMDQFVSILIWLTTC